MATPASTEIHSQTEATTQSAGGLAAGAAALGINGKAMAGQLVNFIILVIILQRFLYKPLVGLLEKRREQIATSMKQATEMEERYQAFQEEQRQLLNEAKNQAAGIIEGAKEATQQLRQESLQSTQSEADRLLARANEEIERQRHKMLAELRQEIGQLVVTTTGKLLGKELDQATQQRLIDEAVREVKS